MESPRITHEENLNSMQLVKSSIFNIDTAYSIYSATYSIYSTAYSIYSTAYSI